MQKNLLLTISAAMALMLGAAFGSCNTKQMATYQYADGSGNVYKIGGKDSRTLSYSPVTPIESSSGVYSGGEPFEKTMTPREYENLIESLEAGFKATGSHIDKRKMMSGLVIRKQGEEETKVILKPGCAELKAIEAQLQAFK